MGTSLNLLQQAYAQKDRAASAWKTGGGKIAGILGPDIPEELLAAAGLLPVRIFGSDRPETALADRYLEKGFDPFVRARFEQIAGGTSPELDRLFISNSSDALIRVYYYLRTMRSVEPEKPVPDLYFYDFLHTRFRSSALYNRRRTEALKRSLEDWLQTPITNDQLADAIRAYNENRGLLQQVARLRSAPQPRISGVQALQIIGASMLMPVREHSRLLRQLLAEAEQCAPIDGVRLFMTGSAQDHTAYYALAESCGCVIVGEDHEMGNRHFEHMADPDADPIDAIVDRLQFRSVSPSQGTVSERTAALAAQVRQSGAEGVVFFIHQADDAPSWDYPEQRKELEAMGIPTLLLDRQPYHPRDPEAWKRHIGEFVQSIRDKSRSGEGIR